MALSIYCFKYNIILISRCLHIPQMCGTGDLPSSHYYYLLPTMTRWREIADNKQLCRGCDMVNDFLILFIIPHSKNLILFALGWPWWDTLLKKNTQAPAPCTTEGAYSKRGQCDMVNDFLIIFIIPLWYGALF